MKHFQRLLALTPALFLALLVAVLCGCVSSLGSAPTVEQDAVFATAEQPAQNVLTQNDVPCRIGWRTMEETTDGRLRLGYKNEAASALAAAGQSIVMQPHPGELTHQQAANAAYDLFAAVGLDTAGQEWNAVYFDFDGARTWAAQQNLDASGTALLDANLYDCFARNPNAKAGEPIYLQCNLYAATGRPRMMRVDIASDGGSRFEQTVSDGTDLSSFWRSEDDYAAAIKEPNEWLASGDALRYAQELAQKAGFVCSDWQALEIPYPATRAEYTAADATRGTARYCAVNEDGNVLTLQLNMNDRCLLYLHCSPGNAAFVGAVPVD